VWLAIEAMLMIRPGIFAASIRLRRLARREIGRRAR
jgi:hypothetical protein